MKTIDDSVIDSVVATLQQNRLFRYDCEKPEESATSRLEKRFAEILGKRYCVAMNSCSSALFISLVASGVKPGDKVLIPAFTFIAVPSSIVHAGGRPVLVEVDDDYAIDPYDLEKKIGPDTKTLLLSYMRGRVPDLDAVTEICRKHEITMIEDAAHSLGVQWNGQLTGRFGRAAAFSAQSYKLIDGGEGGLMVTDDKHMAFRAMLYAGCYERNWTKHFGIDDDAEYVDSMVNQLPAFNFRMSNLSAAALLPQIEQIEARVERYNRNYEQLVRILAASPFIRVPGFHAKVRPAADSLQFYLKDLPLDRIERFQKRVGEKGVKLEIFGLSGKNARCFWHWTFFEQQDCPKTRELLKRTADMRLRLHLEPAEIERMGTAIVETLREVA
jgi:dTDP-4-amino-4,6-dideoxygalactose transaminase